MFLSDSNAAGELDMHRIGGRERASVPPAVPGPNVVRPIGQRAGQRLATRVARGTPTHEKSPGSDTRGRVAESKNGQPGALESLVILRAVVAALGERATPPWWRTQFLTDAGLRAIARVFPRTAVAAAVRSASAAARPEHDRLIGVDKRYHLFRLPTEFERSIEDHFVEPARQAALADFLKSGTDALVGELKRISNEHTVSSAAGPVSIGPVDSVRSGRAIPEFAAHYLAAFSQGSRWFPYVEEREGKR